MVKIVSTISDSCEPYVHYVVSTRYEADETCGGGKKMEHQQYQLVGVRLAVTSTLHSPANRNTKPCELLAGFAIANIPIVTKTMPITNSKTAASTVRQFSRIFG